MEWYRIQVYRKRKEEKTVRKITDRFMRYKDMSVALNESKKLYKVDPDKGYWVRISTVMNIPKEYR